VTDRRVQAYLRKSSRHVPGWLHGHSARFIADLSDIQKRKGLSGSVGEIGVHMGRLFILLHLTRSPGETSFAIDVFGDQHLNVDRSGAGDREKFLANVARWGGSTDGIELIQKSSLAVRPEEILNRAGRCRLLSIDGGHTEECVLNDMRLAEAVLQEHGIVILDDYFHPSWPDVSTGTARYALDPSTRLRPFAITSGKVYFARPEWHAFYRDAIRARQQLLFEKDSRMFGCEVDIYGTQPRTFSPWQILKRRMRATPIGASVGRASASSGSSRGRRRRNRAEIVFTQMTKTDVLTLGARRQHVADLNIGVGDDHAIDEQQHKLATLLKVGLSQPALHP
jgi:hypothetical protein